MALREELERSGNWLFRWRSYLPILTIGMALIALGHFHYPGRRHHYDELWESLCLTISIAGLLIRAYTVGCAPKGTSGRNVSNQVANVLTTSGMYSVVRHPLYLGNFLMAFGISLFPRTWWLPVLYVLIFWLYYERIMFAEEEFLREKFGQSYLSWAARTPAFFPRFKRWQPPEMPFSLRWALRREYASFAAMILVFALLEEVSEFIVHGKFVIDRMWTILISVTLVSYVVVRFLSKKTHLLDVKGR